MPLHIPVLPEAVLRWLQPQPGQTFVDGTLGGGGHARLIAEAVGPDGLVIGLDRDPAAIEAASQNLRGLPLKVVQSNYCDLPEVLADEDIQLEQVDGVVLDLGLSSDQLADHERGFSFDAEGPLDLRFNPEEGEPAYRLLDRLRPETLADLIYRYGEEKFSRRIARKIVECRQQGHPIHTAAELATLVRKCVPRSGKIDSATRTFQALRIAVNEELASIELALRRLPECIRPGGRLVVISFHSLEDRLVKDAFRNNPHFAILTRRPEGATDEEIEANPRSRSAKLRAAEIREE